MERIRPRTLSGFMELLPQKQAKMERMMQVLRDTYSLYGFAPLDTPVIEDAQTMETIRACDKQNVVIATNLASAEIAIMGLQRGDLDWREMLHNKPKFQL